MIIWEENKMIFFFVLHDRRRMLSVCLYGFCLTFRKLDSKKYRTFEMCSLFFLSIFHFHCILDTYLKDGNCIWFTYCDHTILDCFSISNNHTDGLSDELLWHGRRSKSQQRILSPFTTPLYCVRCSLVSLQCQSR